MEEEKADVKVEQPKEDQVQPEKVYLPEDVTLATKPNVIQEALGAVDTTKYNLNVFDELYKKLRQMIGDRQVSAANFIGVVRMAMEAVEQLKTLSGSQKKELVIDLVTKLSMELPISESDKAIISTVISTVLPTIIDAIVDGTLQKIAINVAEDVQEAATKCYGKCREKCGKKKK